jgi:hypothetical protein
MIFGFSPSFLHVIKGLQFLFQKFMVMIRPFVCPTLSPGSVVLTKLTEIGLDILTAIAVKRIILWALTPCNSGRIWGWVGATAGPDDVGGKLNLTPTGARSVQPVTSRYTDCAVPTLNINCTVNVSFNRYANPNKWQTLNNMDFRLCW